MGTLNERYAELNRPVKITIVLPAQVLARSEQCARDRGQSREEALVEAVEEQNVRRAQSANRRDRLELQKALRVAKDQQPIEELLERFRKQMETTPTTLSSLPQFSPEVLTSDAEAPNVSAMALVPQPLRARREALGMTRQELAALVKCSMTALQTLEGGYNAANSGVRDRAEAVLTQAEREAQAA